MKRIALALLIVSLAACSEEPEPPRRTKAPEPVKVEKKPLPTPVVKEVEAPKPPPPPPEPPKEKTPAAPVAKVLLDPALPEWSQQAPAEFKVKFSTSKGDFVVQVQREWAPHGADRIYCLVKNGFYDNDRFFRVVPGFMVQFGLNGSPEVSAVWKNATIPDDPVVQSNTRGMVTFAKRGPNTRTSQIFINFADRNARLDGDGFAPFGKVVEGMEIVDKINSANGERPNQGRIQGEGNEYLNAAFPDLDYVKSARIVP